MADGYGMKHNSSTGVEGLVSWSSIGAFDCIGLDQFLHEDPPNPKDPGRGEHGTRSSLDERLGFVPSPENDQSFFQDFDLKKPAVSSQLPITLDQAKSEIVIAEDHPFPFSFSDLDMEETFELADEEVGIWRGSLKGLCLEEMGVQCQVPERVSDLFSLCSGGGSNSEVCEEQRMMLPSFENPSLLESCLNSITSRLPLEAENPSPSPAVEVGRFS